MNFKVEFHLDGTGLYYYPDEPIHLDALLAWALAPMQCKNRNISKEDIPEDVKIPLLRSKINGHEVWHASALFPEGETFETLRNWRKRFRVNRIEMTSGRPEIESGTYRNWDSPMPLILTRKMIAYASGNRKECQKVLRRHLKYLGKKHAYGIGKIIKIEAIEIEDDFSFWKDGKAMRWLPDSGGTEFVRPAPPYWNPNGRVDCLAVGHEAR